MVHENAVRVAGSDGLRLVAANRELASEALERIAPLVRERGTHGEWIDFAGGRAWFKAEPLRGRARIRHALRRTLLRRPLPRLAEYENLRWLRERLFQAPRPLAAGTACTSGSARWQFLLTREVNETSTLGHYLGEGAEDPTEVLDELAGEVARMHALHFIHRDLYPRNLLVKVKDASCARRIFFLDAWRGGARLQLRGAAYDLGCFFLHAPEWLSPRRQRRFFERYLEHRAVQGKPARAAPLRRAVIAERAAQFARLARKPPLRRGRPLPPERWMLG